MNMETIIKIVATLIIGPFVANIILAFIQPSGFIATLLYFGIIALIASLIFGKVRMGRDGGRSGNVTSSETPRPDRNIDPVPSGHTRKEWEDIQAKNR